MQYPNFALAILVLPAALALPSSDHGHYYHHHGHGPYKSGHISGAPSASGAVGAPFGLSNATVGASGSGTVGTNYQTRVVQNTLYHTINASPIESASTAGDSSPDTCGSTSTVTINPTTTVTVTGDGVPSESGIESSASEIASSVAAVTSSSAPESVTPVVTASPKGDPVAPIESSSAPVPTQAATSASVTPSVTPVQSTSAAPVASASSTAAAAPSTPPSGNSNADYCKYDGQGTTPPTWSGANYTGGVKGTKRGIVFVAGSTDDKKALVTQIANPDANVHWLGNYYSGPPGDALAPHVEFVPQMYGLQSTNDWFRNADASLKNHTKYFLSFGEPGTPNKDLHQDAVPAAQFYMDQMQKYTTEGVTVGAPGCLGGPQDWQWDQQFLCRCQTLGCNIGFIAGHWFDVAAPLEQQLERAKGTVNTYIAVAKGKPVWMDNIWAKGTPAEQQAFMDAMIPWLEDNPAIQRYGWVPQDADNDGNGFVYPNGEVTETGKHFMTMN